MNVKLHWAERFINWFPHHTDLYVRRKKRGEQRRILGKDVVAALASFFDGLLAEAKAEGAAEAEAVLSRNGFRRCDIAACNCGSWHAGPNRRADALQAEVEMLRGGGKP